jgi:hypothetical protein
VGTWYDEFCAQFTLFNQPWHKVCSKAGWALHEVLYTTKLFHFQPRRIPGELLIRVHFLWSFKDAPFDVEVN